MSTPGRRSNRSTELSARGAFGNGTGRGWRIGRDAHLHLHGEMVRRKSDIGTVERGRMTRIAHDRNGEKAEPAGAAGRGVEIDPTGARQIDLRPAMGRPTG